MSTFSETWSDLANSGRFSPYVLIDCAGLQGGSTKLPRHICFEFDCLFAGRLATELADVGPYLGRLKSFARDIEKTVENLLAIQVGTLLVAEHGSNDIPSQAFAQLHRHLRKFNIVQGPNDKQLFFRYYDPRLIYSVLQALDSQQVNEFFGPINALVVTDTSGRTITIKATDFTNPAT
jgi:hypothetical protein